MEYKKDNFEMTYIKTGIGASCFLEGLLPLGITKCKKIIFIGSGRSLVSDIGIAKHTGHGIPRIISKYGKEAFEITDSYINVVIPFDKKILHNNNVGLKLSHLEEQIITILQSD